MVLCLLTCLTSPARAAVVISEFLAVNTGGLTDEDGDSSDWIEIHNNATTALNLAGWRLTDEADNLDKWVFPSTNLSPGGYLVVFASGKNRAISGAPLHTSFSLSAEGEYLALVQPDGLTITSEYAPTFPAQRANVSYGLTPTNLAVQKFFAVLTPGTTNSTSFFAQAAIPQFMPERGFFTTNFSVTLTSTSPTAVIRYTLNGDQPTATSGIVYTNPIVITNTTTLAAGFETDAAPSPIITHTYIFAAQVVRQSPTGTVPSGWPTTWGGNVVDYGMDPNIVNHANWATALTNSL
ncbi:MAG: lamin tail domain-containing protein [Verrucomicrobiota bacterium]